MGVVIAALAALYGLLLVTLPPVLIVGAVWSRVARRLADERGPVSTVEELLPLLHTSGGVLLDWLDDSPDVLILGHPDDDAVTEAVRRLHRDLAPDGPDLADDDILDGLYRTHAVLITVCSGADGARHPGGACGDCADIQDQEWAVLLDRDPAETGAFAVTVWAQTAPHPAGAT